VNGFKFLGRLKAVLVLGFVLLTTSLALAYDVSPMIYELAPSGPRSVQVLRIHNDSDRPITIELEAERRQFDEQGRESRTPADDDFILFPPQAVIPPGQTQAVRVQYVGPQALERSVMYTVTVKQVPVALPLNGPSGVQFVFNFSTVANIVPPGARAVVEAVSVTRVENGYALRLRNTGNKYANLALSRVTLTAGGQSTVVEGDAWRRALGSSWLLPGNQRIITIPAAALTGAAAAAPAITGDNVTARFELIETAAAR
jgi:fimbrial chaperone protein